MEGRRISARRNDGRVDLRVDLVCRSAGLKTSLRYQYSLNINIKTLNYLNKRSTKRKNLFGQRIRAANLRDLEIKRKIRKKT